MALRVAVEHQRRQDRVVLEALARVRASWAAMSVADLDASWERRGGDIIAATAVAQYEAAVAGARYVPTALRAQGVGAVASAGSVEPAMLAGVASDGRALGSLLYGGVVASGRALNAGTAAPVALREGLTWLQRAVTTQVTDAGRGATFAGMVSTPAVKTWVRMVNPDACSRCIILAGRTYRLEGFERHPRCRCVHVPSAENTPGDIGTDPVAYFNSMSEAEQDRVFTKAGARAIRDGADMGQVVNARRGMFTADFNSKGWKPRGRLTRHEVDGVMTFSTLEGTTRRGSAYQAMRKAPWLREEVKYSRTTRLRAPRLMPEGIYEMADDRDHAVQLLRLYGYIK